MALRDFTDGAGRRWRVWDVSAQAIHPATRGEDYMRDYLGGWLAFESADGLVKCRLTPIPSDWARAQPHQLVDWLQSAETVRGERASAAGAAVASSALQPAQLPADGRAPVRTFRFPGGRFWTVTEFEVPSEGARSPAGDGGAHRILRFMSGSRSMDVTRWPPDWATLPDVELAELLSSSFPRQGVESDDAVHQRRSTDAGQR